MGGGDGARRSAVPGWAAARPAPGDRRGDARRIDSSHRICRNLRCGTPKRKSKKEKAQIAFISSPQLSI